jgi:hypothetical protein
LDIGCFFLFKKVYKKQVENLIRLYINYITKLEYLPVFQEAYRVAFTKQNICSSFRRTRLVLYNPSNILSYLHLQLRTPTPPADQASLWVSKILQNQQEIHSQTQFIKERIAKYQNSSPTPINKVLDQLLQGTQTMMHTDTLLKAELTKLQEANKVITKHQKKHRKRIQQGGVLAIQEGQDIIEQAAIEKQISGEIRNRNRQLQGVEGRQQHCSLYGALGNNSRTCTRS